MPIQESDLQIDMFDRVDIAIGELDRMKLEVGWFEGAKYEEGISVASVAYQNEYGDPQQNIPPRPFLRPTVEKYQTVWKQGFEKSSKRIINGKSTSEEILEVMGLLISGQIRKSITEVHYPKLSKRTLAARYRIRGVTPEEASDELKKPLVFEAVMLNSVSYAIDGGEVQSPYARESGR